MSVLIAVVVTAVAVAALLSATAPAVPNGTASITGLAVPRIIVVGERTGAYGSLAHGSDVPADQRLVVCITKVCEATGSGVAVPPLAEWHGFAGALEPRTAGSVLATWLIAEADDEAGARATVVWSVTVEAVMPESVRDAQR